MFESLGLVSTSRERGEEAYLYTAEGCFFEAMNTGQIINSCVRSSETGSMFNSRELVLRECIREYGSRIEQGINEMA